MRFPVAFFVLSCASADWATDSAGRVRWYEFVNDVCCASHVYQLVFRNLYFCPVVDLCDFVTAWPGKVCKPPVCPFPGYTNAGQPFRMVHVCHSNWGSLINNSIIQ
jgi:hypothetical protein